MRALLQWFKREFFTWADGAECRRCGRTTKRCVGHDRPTPEERRHLAGVTECYACPTCNAVVRFPRYNDPGEYTRPPRREGGGGLTSVKKVKLLDTRVGRCGEWANCFCLCCRALGFETRWVQDWTDHVCECMPQRREERRRD